MESLNKNLQNPYLTMRPASKESLDLPTDFPLQEETYPRFCIEHHPLFNSVGQKLLKNYRKNAQRY